MAKKHEFSLTEFLPDMVPLDAEGRYAAVWEVLNAAVEAIREIRPNADINVIWHLAETEAD